MIKTTDYTYLSSNKINHIHAKVWASNETPKGVIHILHGVAEHIERYDAFAKYMAGLNYVVVGNDHLGHGKSVRDESELGWFGESDGWDTIIRDEHILHETIIRKHPNTPLIMLGHSMGSFMARTYIAEYPDDYDLCILSGTGYQPKFTTSLGKTLANFEIHRHSSKHRSKLLQKIAFGNYLRDIEDPIGQNDWICRDKSVILAYDADPLCGYTATAGLMRDMMDGLGRICSKKYISRMNKDLPVLFIAGEADPVGSWGSGIKKCEQLFHAVGMKDISVILYPGARHEVLNETNRQQVWQDITDWIQSKPIES